MKNILKVLCIIVFSFSFCFCIDSRNTVYALEDTVISSESVEDSGIIKVRDNEDDGDDEENCEYILGDPDDESSVAYLLQKIFDYVKIIGPILVILLSSIDFAKNAVSGDADGMKKATNKLLVRLLCAVGVFFVPLLASWILALVNNGRGSCGIS